MTIRRRLHAGTSGRRCMECQVKLLPLNASRVCAPCTQKREDRTRRIRQQLGSAGRAVAAAERRLLTSP